MIIRLIWVLKNQTKALKQQRAHYYASLFTREKKKKNLEEEGVSEDKVEELASQGDNEEGDEAKSNQSNSIKEDDKAEESLSKQDDEVDPIKNQNINQNITTYDENLEDRFSLVYPRGQPFY